MDAYCPTYQLFFTLPAAAHIAVGKLGSFDFPAGRYVYTGSAKRNIEARLRRHRSRDKKLRWHIDYLLAYADGVETRVYAESECQLNQATAGMIPVPRFGASDCTQGCGSHLKYLG
ncbi:MAG: GIY-YIG nuclease family protein [Sulfuricellaceae bacterium]|nr:GIY-YIG nuclease family protein [Sulfuricellaceae bacterium]